MEDTIYRRLAQRLDTIPNGFPATESGAELRLLAKLFTPEEAALATVMKLTREGAAAIAERAGIETRQARGLLHGMARKGLIHARKGSGELVYALMPFVVGFYEEQVGTMDVEMAILFEDYFQETRGGSITVSPSVHRVIPVGEAIPVELEIYPYERAAQLVEEAQSWGVRDCICRLQKQLIGDPCDHPLEMCLIFAPVPNLFDHSTNTRAITRDEALQVLKDAQDAGLVHSAGNYRDGNHYICNCCTCSCGILRAIAEFDLPAAVARSDFRAVVDVDECLGCEDCVMHCQFNALDVDEVCMVDYDRCLGCGQCVTVCSTGALSLERRPAGEIELPPADNRAWMQTRAHARGISIDDLL